MILGCCKFGFDYNGKQVPKKEVFEIFEYFEQNGGIYLDTAYNYREASKIIGEYFTKINTESKLKVITKIWQQEEFWKELEILKREKIYCCMARENSKDRDIIEFLKDQKEQGVIEKTGMTIYYPEERRSDMNILFIPNNFEAFKDNLKVMMLHSDIHVRSLFNLNNKIPWKALEDFNKFKKYERKDIKHKVEAVIGVSNLQQLKENMEYFK